MKALLSSPKSSACFALSATSLAACLAGSGPDALEPPSIRAGHTGPDTSFHIRFAANSTGLEEGAPSNERSVYRDPRTVSSAFHQLGYSALR
jgi:hypothetical protein